ncbi:MAG: caspase family protein [Rhodomicrobium sp.]
MSVVRIFLFAAVFLIASGFAALADSPKLALIVTNQAYPSSIGALENTHRDGKRIASALTSLGFEVVHKRDLDKAAMLSGIADYVARLEKAGPEAVTMTGQAPIHSLS